MNNIAVKQWCFYRYKAVLRKFKEFLNNEKRKIEEENEALELRREHMRKEGIDLNNY